MISLLISILPIAVFSQTLHMAVLGGSGEPHKTWDGRPNETTIFDPGLEKMGQFARAHPNIRTEVLFNGGHRQTESIARREFGSSNPFTSQGFYQTIESYRRKILNGEIKSGDKLLINLYSHGANRDTGEQTHKIAAGSGSATNFDNLSGTTTVSLDVLKSLADAAKMKGVKLGIVDLSCHSGHTLSLANENTCVISATGPYHYSGAGSKSFGVLFASALKAGKSLEDAYLSARSDFVDPSFPMISSPAGQDIQGRLYDDQTPFLYYYNPHSDKFTPYMEKIATNVGECRIDGNLLGLNTRIDEILQLGAPSELTIRLNAFRDALTEYHAYIRDVKRRMDEFGIGEMGKKYQVCSGTICETYSAKELAATNFSAFIPYYEDQARSGTPAERQLARQRINILRQADELKSHILRENPRLLQAAQFWQSFRDLQRNTSILQSQVAKTQRELYLEMYKRTNATGSNPCQDFKL